MAVGELLSLLGVKGSIATVVSAGIALYHGRSLLTFAARIGTWLRVAGVLGFILILATTGLIPGVDLSIQFGVIVDALSGFVPEVSLW